MEPICTEGELGHAMVIMVRGFAQKTQTRGRSNKDAQPPMPYQLCPGDSFGEEILLGIKFRYTYSITAESKVVMYRIGSKEFQDSFRQRPDALRRMKANYCNKNAQLASPSATSSTDFTERLATEHGRSSVLQGGERGVPPSFPDAVFEAFHEITHKLKKLEGQTESPRERTASGGGSSDERHPPKLARKLSKTINGPSYDAE